MEEVLGLAGAIVVAGAPSIVDRRTLSLRGGRAPQALMKRVAKIHRAVVRGYCLEAGGHPEDFGLVCTIEETPRVLIVPVGNWPPQSFTEAKAILTLEEAMAYAELGRKAEPHTNKPLPRSDTSDYA